jgi:hypothetical protein
MKSRRSSMRTAIAGRRGARWRRSSAKVAGSPVAGRRTC